MQQMQHRKKERKKGKERSFEKAEKNKKLTYTPVSDIFYFRRRRDMLKGRHENSMRATNTDTSMKTYFLFRMLPIYFVARSNCFVTVLGSAVSGIINKSSRWSFFLIVSVPRTFLRSEKS